MEADDVEVMFRNVSLMKDQINHLESSIKKLKTEQYQSNLSQTKLKKKTKARLRKQKHNSRKVVRKINLLQAQSRTSNWASTSGGWANGRRSLLYGLGTNWCVCPKQIWKHLGDDTDDEPITRRKCISVIMGTILAILLFAIIVGLIIGLANMQGPTESPIRFVVIPSELDLEDESNAAEGN